MYFLRYRNELVNFLISYLRCLSLGYWYDRTWGACFNRLSGINKDLCFQEPYPLRKTQNSARKIFLMFKSSLNFKSSIYKSLSCFMKAHKEKQPLFTLQNLGSKSLLIEALKWLHASNLVVCWNLLSKKNVI